MTRLAFSIVRGSDFTVVSISSSCLEADDDCDEHPAFQDEIVPVWRKRNSFQKALHDEISGSAYVPGHYLRQTDSEFWLSAAWLS
jgi:hypothetical protein